ncbi:MAG: hypothetical protein AB2693_29400 [Candidatus Thiodiazotropha sp.]
MRAKKQFLVICPEVATLEPEWPGFIFIISAAFLLFFGAENEASCFSGQLIPFLHLKLNYCAEMTCVILWLHDLHCRLKGENL